MFALRLLHTAMIEAWPFGVKVLKVCSYEQPNSGSFLLKNLFHFCCSNLPLSRSLVLVQPIYSEGRSSRSDHCVLPVL